MLEINSQKEWFEGMIQSKKHVEKITILYKIQKSCKTKCAVWKWTNQLRLTAGNKVQKTEWLKEKSLVEYLVKNFNELKTNIE